MNTINDEELQQLDAVCGVTIYESLYALSAYEKSCIAALPDIALTAATVPAYY
jgi:hypothetical protein